MAVEPGTHNSFGLNCTDSKGNTIEILTTDLINILVDNTTYSGTISYTSGVFYLDGITDENTAHSATITINKEGYSQYTFTVSLGVDGFTATVNVTLTAPLTLSDRLQIISDSKKAIKAAIEAKGVTDVGDKIADYAGKIESIESGGIDVDDNSLLAIVTTNASSFDFYVSTDNSTFTKIEPSCQISPYMYLFVIPNAVAYVKFLNVIREDGSYSGIALIEYYWGSPMMPTTYLHNTTRASSQWSSGGSISGALDSTNVYKNTVKYIHLNLNLNCLIKGTLITLANGIKKPIEDITFDDDILVWNFYEGKFDTAKPVFIKSAQIASKYNLCTFSDGTKIGFVGEGGEKGYHRIFNADKGSFTYTGNVKDTPIGTCTFNENSSFPELVSQEIIEEPVEYYNVITDKHYNLFANSILTSMHWSNQYDIDTDKMMYILDNQNITDETISKEMNEMKENNILWKTL